MDGYVSKPIKMMELESEIKRFAPAAATANPKVTSIPRAPIISSQAEDNKDRRMVHTPDPVKDLSGKVFDAYSALDNLDGDKAFLKDITNLFMEKTPLQIQALKKEVAAKDESAIELLAHKLKGSASSVGAKRLADEAFRLELAAGKGDVAKCSLCFEHVEKELKNLKEELSEFDWENILQPST